MIRAFLVLVLGSWVSFAHDPITTSLTWSQEISRIVLKRCGGCHREGGTAMSLGTYEEARPWAKAIRDEVVNRRMPPWGAVKGFGEFRNDQSMTQEEINRIAQWVEGGAPEGDPAYLPDRLRAEGPEKLPAGKRVIALPDKGAVLLGIRPLQDVAHSKITATLPDGTVEPLIWLLNYQNKWNRTFAYRDAIFLPAGTAIRAEPPVPFELLISRGAQPKAPSRSAIKSSESSIPTERRTRLSPIPSSAR